MSNIHNILSNAFNVVENSYKTLARGNGKWVEYCFQLKKFYYNWCDDDVSITIWFSVRYTSISEKVVVQWRVKSVNSPYNPSLNIQGDWQQIANHELDWKDCWKQDITKFCCETLVDRFNQGRADSYYFYCHDVLMYD